MTKRERQEGAIKRLEKTIEQHKASTALTEKILEDKEKKKTEEEIEKIRKKKLERAEQTLKYTKANMR